MNVKDQRYANKYKMHGKAKKYNKRENNITTL